MTRKAQIAAKVEKLHTLKQLTPEWEALVAEIRALRQAEGNPLANVKSGVYFTGKGASRQPFLVR